MTGFNVKASIDGLEDLEQLLLRLPEKIGDKLLDQSCAAGARVIGRNWRQNAPTPSLKKTGVRSGAAARKKLRLGRSKVRGVAIVAHLRPASRLAHLFEFGTVNRFHASGKATGRHPKRPYMRRGIDQSRDEVREKMREILAKGIAREAEKLAR